MLRRHDYSVNIAGGFKAAQPTSELCGGQRHSSAIQAARLHARTRSPADRGNADGRNRFQRGAVRDVNSWQAGVALASAATLPGRSLGPAHEATAEGNTGAAVH
jgi:hypothetical protein